MERGLKKCGRLSKEGATGKEEHEEAIRVGGQSGVRGDIEKRGRWPKEVKEVTI
jgi:hypothetical protein